MRDAGPRVDRARDEVLAFLEAQQAELCRRQVECEPYYSDIFPLAAEVDCHPASGAYSFERWESGAVGFDASLAAECLRRLREDDDCLDWDDARFCQSVFAPALPLGAACDAFVPDDCAAELHCDWTRCVCVESAAIGEPCGGGVECASSALCVDGTCSPWPGPGAPCEFSFQCSPSEMPCDDPPCEELVCIEGSCAPVTALVAGGPCAEGSDCGPDLVCEFGLPSMCIVPPQLGEPCSWECAEGLQCASGTCATLVDEGGACSRHESCSPAAPNCVANVCTSDATGRECFPSPWPSPSWSPDSASYCPFGYVCVEDAAALFGGTCQRMRGLGEPCEQDAICATASRCVDGRCVRVVTPDMECGEEAVCPQTHVCDEGRCVARPLIGEACSAALPCLLSACIDGICGERAPGASCEQSWECSVTCRDGVCIEGLPEGSPCGTGDAACGEGLLCGYGAPSRQCIRVCRGP